MWHFLYLSSLTLYSTERACDIIKNQSNTYRDHECDTTSRNCVCPEDVLGRRGRNGTDFRAKDTSPPRTESLRRRWRVAPAAFAWGELRQRAEARRELAAGERRRPSRLPLPPPPSPPGRPRAAPAPLRSPLRGKSLSRAAPQTEPVHPPPPAPAPTLRVPS